MALAAIGRQRQRRPGGAHRTEACHCCCCSRRSGSVTAAFEARTGLVGSRLAENAGLARRKLAHCAWHAALTGDIVGENYVEQHEVVLRWRDQRVPCCACTCAAGAGGRGANARPLRYQTLALISRSGWTLPLLPQPPPVVATHPMAPILASSRGLALSSASAVAGTSCRRPPAGGRRCCGCGEGGTCGWRRAATRDSRRIVARPG